MYLGTLVSLRKDPKLQLSKVNLEGVSPGSSLAAVSLSNTKTAVSERKARHAFWMHPHACLWEVQTWTGDQGAKSMYFKLMMLVLAYLVVGMDCCRQGGKAEEKLNKNSEPKNHPPFWLRTGPAGTPQPRHPRPRSRAPEKLTGFCSILATTQSLQSCFFLSPF